MGKIINAIEMLNYLNTGNKYSVKELADKIGITERMVRYYKSELELAGIPIETFMGPNGGYYIINRSNYYNHFNKYDLRLLENVNKILQELNYECIDKYREIVNKIRCSNDIEEEKSKYYLDFNYLDNSGIYYELRNAILNKKSITILYKNLNQEWQERIIHPLQLFSYKGKSYITAFCELRNDIRHFELDRIKINKK